MSVLKLYRPTADKNNLLVLHASKTGCCIDKILFCKYVAPNAAYTNMPTGIILLVDDVPTTFNFTNPVDSHKTLRMEIAAVLKAAGYDPYYEDVYKGVIVNADQIIVIGEAPLVSIIRSTEVPFVQKCKTGPVCKYQGNIVYGAGAPAAYTLSGTTFPDTDLTGLPTATGNTAAVKASVEAALTANGYTFELVEVTEDTENSEYVFKIHTTETEVLSLNDVELLNCGCYTDFIA